MNSTSQNSDEPLPLETGEPPDLSVVIPVLNEEATVGEAVRRLEGTLGEGLSREYLFVDDGSSDRTPEIIAQLAESSPRVRAVMLSRNFGHQAALTAGLTYARGRAVVLMDGDLQDPPEVIPQFVDLWREGYAVVYGIRRRRREGWLKRLGYYAFYRTLARLANIEIPLDSGDFCLMDRRVVDFMNLLPERDRFLRGLRAWVGLRQIGVEYDRDPRHAGRPKYSLLMLCRLAASGIVSFSEKPLHLATKLGFITAGLSLATATFYFARWALGLGSRPAGFLTLVLALLFLFGLQFVLIGIIGAYVGSIHAEVKRRPHYLVNHFLGFEGRGDGSTSLGRDRDEPAPS